MKYILIFFGVAILSGVVLFNLACLFTNTGFNYFSYDTLLPVMGFSVNLGAVVTGVKLILDRISKINNK